MALLPISTDYTNKDFDSLRIRLFALVRATFPEWTDQNVADFGNILVELFCHVGDVLGYYIDASALESRIVTATQRKSLLGLCKLVGYVPSGANAATAELLFQIPTVASGDVVIAAETVCSTGGTADPVNFQVLDSVTIPMGSISAVGTVEHSTNVTETFTSTGLANQEFTLGTTPFLDSSCVITDDGGAFTEVSNFLSSASDDAHFTVVVDQNDRARVRFGNGTSGSIPIGTITIAYKVGGGAAGNVSIGSINTITGTFTDGTNPVTVTVANAAAASGGADRQTIEQIKLLAPASNRVLTRCVTIDDFEIVALNVSGVARALMLTSNEDSAIEENCGILFIVPTGGGTPSDLLKTQVLTAVTVTYPCTLTFQPSVQTPLYLTVNVEATVYFRQGTAVATAAAAIRSALTDFFALTNSDGTVNEQVDFGAKMTDVNGEPNNTIAWSDVHNVVRDTSGVRKVSATSTGFVLNGEHADVVLASQQFPVLGTVTLINGDTGATL